MRFKLGLLDPRVLFVKKTSLAEDRIERNQRRFKTLLPGVSWAILTRTLLIVLLPIFIVWPASSAARNLLIIKNLNFFLKWNALFKNNFFFFYKNKKNLPRTFNIYRRSLHSDIHMCRLLIIPIVWHNNYTSLLLYW